MRAFSKTSYRSCAGLAAATALLLSFASCGGSTTLLEPKPAADFSLADINGKQVRLSELNGNVVLLNFWETWCPPCRVEMPWFVDFQQKYKDRGFVVLAVSLDAEGWKVVKPFAEKFQLNFPVVVGDHSLVEKYGGLSVLPTSFVIDKEGNVRSRHDGLRDKADWEAEIESLL